MYSAVGEGRRLCVYTIIYINYSWVWYLSKIMVKEAVGGTFSVKKKYPNVRKCYMYQITFLGSSYLCESTFSHLQYISPNTDQHCQMNTWMPA